MLFDASGAEGTGLTFTVTFAVEEHNVVGFVAVTVYVVVAVGLTVATLLVPPPLFQDQFNDPDPELATWPLKVTFGRLVEAVGVGLADQNDALLVEAYAYNTLLLVVVV